MNSGLWYGWKKMLRHCIMRPQGYITPVYYPWACFGIAHVFGGSRQKTQKTHL